MKLRGNPWLLAVLAAVICAGAYLVVRWRSSRVEMPVQDALRRLPYADAVVLHMDVAALRSAGLEEILAGSSVAEEPDYRRFVSESGFDWKTDLDSVTASYHNGTWYLFARGRFDWGKLRNYAILQGGTCLSAVCDAPAVTPGKRVSFYPVSSRVLAFASGIGVRNVFTLQIDRKETIPAPTPAPAWVTFPGSILSGDPNVPSGSRLFAKALSETRRTTFRLQPSPGAAGEIVMDAHCAGPEAAKALHTQLAGVTREFKNYFERLGQKPNPADLSGVLLSGSFDLQNDHVLGRWPIERRFLESIAGGQP